MHELGLWGFGLRPWFGLKGKNIRKLNNSPLKAEKKSCYQQGSKKEPLLIMRDSMIQSTIIA